jgi:hypothetical protein
MQAAIVSDGDEWIPASSTQRRALSLSLTSVLVRPVTLRRMRRLRYGAKPKETAPGL